MSNSSLATYIDRGSGNYNSRTQLITRITVHQAATVGGCEILSDILKSSPNASFNYGIGNDGTIGLYIDENLRSWSTGNVDNDQKSVSIVVANSDNSGAVSNLAWDSLVRLCIDICRRNFIKELKFTGQLATSNLTLHRWFNPSVNCPGSYLESRMGLLASTVTSSLKNTTLASSEADARMTQSTIVVEALNPYLVTVDPSALKVNYADFRTAGVVGVMLYCGGYFNSSHLKKSAYISSTLKQQVAEVDEAHLPYALYCDVRANNVGEAQKEIDELFYVISKYPPKLGIWLGLDFGKLSTVEKNNEILERYYKYIYRWGLHDKCGVYCSKEQYKKFEWTQFSDRMSLWIQDNISSISNISDLLTPTFFRV